MLDDLYLERTARSAAAWPRFTLALPGGETRSVAYYPPYPVVLERGRGAVVHDLDGNEYVDVLNNYTALIHGHAHAAITAAIQDAASEGTVFPAPHKSQAALAECLIERLPAAERVRFTNSGSEASILAARLARHITGRRKLLLFEGGYHGTGALFADPDPDVVRVPYNDVHAARAALDESFAAVFVEPFLGSGGVIPATAEFLEAVGASAQRAGALFVFDEIQALRSHVNGAHRALPHAPDLVLLGKIIGGGIPIGAVTGSATLLESLSSNAASRLPHSGTFNGNVLAMKAGLVSMQLLDATAIQTLNDRAARLQASITDAAHRNGLEVAVTRSGSILHVHFLPAAPANAKDAAGAPAEPTRLLHIALLLNGVYAAPRGMLNLSTALKDELLARVEAAFDSAMAMVAKHWSDRA